MKAQLTIFLTIFISSITFCQQPDSTLTVPKQLTINDLGNDMSFLSEKEFILSLLVGVILIIALLIIQNIVKSRNFSDVNTTRIFVSVLIILSSIFLITAGFSSQQIAPITGLFGTMVGYMLGLSSRDKDNTSNN